MRAGTGASPGCLARSLAEGSACPVKVRQGLEALTAPVVVWTGDKRRPIGGAHAPVFSYFSAICGIFHYWPPDCGDCLPDFADHADRLGARGHLGGVCAESVQDGQED